MGAFSECRFDSFYTYCFGPRPLFTLHCDFKIKKMERCENSISNGRLWIGARFKLFNPRLYRRFLGWQLNKISWFQDLRGNFSGWALLTFGCIYLIYGIVQAVRNKPHKHFDVMGDDVYVYEHNHSEIVMPQKRIKVTPLVLFMIFVMGPSEPLIPLLFYSGVKHSTSEIAVLVISFTTTTVLTMLGMVLLGRYGYSTLFNTEKLERYMGMVSGAVVTVCGIGMVFLGW